MINDVAGAFSARLSSRRAWMLTLEGVFRTGRAVLCRLRPEGQHGSRDDDQRQLHVWGTSLQPQCLQTLASFSTSSLQSGHLE